MKSSDDVLRTRGSIDESDVLPYQKLSTDEILVMLNDPAAYKRTIAARLCGTRSDENLVPVLCIRLAAEKSLYTKIALAESLKLYGRAAAQELVKYLGKIGNNQHASIPAAVFKKKSYPLPRDIAARTLAHIGHAALPEIKSVFNGSDIPAILEAIDAAGFIAFYEFSPEIVPALITCFEKHNGDELVRFKMMTAFQIFNEKTVCTMLKKAAVSDTNKRIAKEAEMSLEKIRRRNTP